MLLTIQNSFINLLMVVLLNIKVKVIEINQYQLQDLRKLGSNTNEMIKNLFNFLLRRYHEGFQVSMRRSEFVFDYVESLNYIFHKADLKR